MVIMRMILMKDQLKLLSVGRYCSVYFLCRFFLVLVSTTTEQDCYHHAYFIRHVIENCRGDVFFLRRSPASCPTGPVWSGKYHVAPRGTSWQRNENVRQRPSQQAGRRLPHALLPWLARSPVVVPHWVAPCPAPNPLLHQLVKSSEKYRGAHGAVFGFVF